MGWFGNWFRRSPPSEPSPEPKVPKCSTCKGTGEIEKEWSQQCGTYVVTCWTCKGTGDAMCCSCNARPATIFKDIPAVYKENGWKALPAETRAYCATCFNR